MLRLIVLFAFVSYIRGAPAPFDHNPMDGRKIILFKNYSVNNIKVIKFIPICNFKLVYSRETSKELI